MAVTGSFTVCGVVPVRVVHIIARGVMAPQHHNVVRTKHVLIAGVPISFTIEAYKPATTSTERLLC